MTLQQVAMFDEGLYQCEMRGEKSLPSRLRVRADEKVHVSSPPPSVQPSAQSPVSPLGSSSLVLGLITGSVLILLVLLVLVVRRCQRHTEENGLNSHILPQQQRRTIRRTDFDESSLYTTVCYSTITISQTKDPAARAEERMQRHSDARTGTEIRVRPNQTRTSPLFTARLNQD
ncbi:hypothetical protein NL108_017030 [Boleophthalmus pectinirostris]|nr:hypothetical protein NL108_017030 [Boleophthalmus pectinirostris]